MKNIQQLGISPSPWNIKQGCSIWMEDSHGDCICDDLDSRETRAIPNARLIAAAPVLYEALTPFVSLMDWMLKNAARLNILDMVPRIREHGDRARAALAAASGESEKEANDENA